MDWFQAFNAALVGGILAALVIWCIADKFDWREYAGRVEQQRQRALQVADSWKDAARMWRERAEECERLLRDQSKVATAPSLPSLSAAQHAATQTPRGMLAWSEHPPFIFDRWTTEELN